MKKTSFFFLIVIFIIALSYLIWSQNNKETSKTVTNFAECVVEGNPVLESYPSQCLSKEGDYFVENIGNELEKIDIIRVDSPRPNESVSSPLTITGQARGNWFFEASFPVKIFDSENKQLGQSVAQAETDWMTSDFVSFTAILNFIQPSTKSGYLLLENDNPSGLIENAEELRIPINFSPNSITSFRPIKLYYYNSDKDNNNSCSVAGLVAVDRQLPITKTPIQDAIKLLLRGELSSVERASGLSTEFPLTGLELKAASLSNNNLTLTFSDPSNSTSGGSCRAAILWAQISETAKQFPEVKTVNFLPEDLFQP